MMKMFEADLLAICPYPNFMELESDFPEVGPGHCLQVSTVILMFTLGRESQENYKLIISALR
jgi:hypothetical protein